MGEGGTRRGCLLKKTETVCAKRCIHEVCECEREGWRGGGCGEAGGVDWVMVFEHMECKHPRCTEQKVKGRVTRSWTNVTVA